MFSLHWMLVYGGLPHPQKSCWGMIQPLRGLGVPLSFICSTLFSLKLASLKKEICFWPEESTRSLELLLMKSLSCSASGFCPSMALSVFCRLGLVFLLMATWVNWLCLALGKSAGSFPPPTSTRTRTTPFWHDHQHISQMSFWEEAGTKHSKWLREGEGSGP